jgi:hypothetical protein
VSEFPTLARCIKMAEIARGDIPRLVKPESLYMALVVLDDRRIQLERELAKWQANSTLLSGALLLLQEAGIPPSSTELIAASNRAALVTQTQCPICGGVIVGGPTSDFIHTPKGSTHRKCWKEESK